MKFARVIPVLRTPPGVESFDYQIPEGLGVQAGDLVRMPFRKGKSVALVEKILNDSPFAKKALPLVDRYADLHFPEAVVRLLHWTANRTFSSKPSVLKAWVRALPKKSPPPSRSEGKGRGEVVRDRVGNMTAHWVVDPEGKLIERAQQRLRDGQRLLILTPWKARIGPFQSALPGSRALHSDLNDGDAFRAWCAFVNGETDCLIATRLGAWLAPFADLVLLDEPENDDHKQDELAPRYDARLMLAWCAQHAGIHVESFGLTPPLHTSAVGPTIPAELSVIIRHPNGRSNIPMIQADALEQLSAHDGPRIIVHPIRGMNARLVCRDCGWRATCDRCGFALSAESDHAVCRQCGKKHGLPLTCPACGGADLGKSTPGIERLKQAWAKHEPDVAVEWRSLSNEDAELPIPENAVVLVTDGSLLGGVVEDVRRRERLCLAFRRLADRVARVRGLLVIQCDEASAPQWNPWLAGEGFKAFQEEQRHERKLFAYPPAARLVKVIVEATAEQAPSWHQRLKKHLPSGADVRGPFAVAHRPSSRRQRLIFHLLFPPHTSEAELIGALTPLAGSTIIDLDPIAFFK